MPSTKPCHDGVVAGLDDYLAGCTRLLSLNANGCIGLVRLALGAHTELERLEAAGCQQLRSIVCGSAALSICSVQSCHRLEVRNLICLRTLLVEIDCL